MVGYRRGSKLKIYTPPQHVIYPLIKSYEVDIICTRAKANRRRRRKKNEHPSNSTHVFWPLASSSPAKRTIYRIQMTPSHRPTAKPKGRRERRRRRRQQRMRKGNRFSLSLSRAGALYYYIYTISSIYSGTTSAILGIPSPHRPQKQITSPWTIRLDDDDGSIDDSGA